MVTNLFVLVPGSSSRVFPTPGALESSEIWIRQTPYYVGRLKRGDRHPVGARVIGNGVVQAVVGGGCLCVAHAFEARISRDLPAPEPSSGWPLNSTLLFEAQSRRSANAGEPHERSLLMVREPGVVSWKEIDEDGRIEGGVAGD